MARFDVNRSAPTLVSLEHATDPVGKVIGFYAKTTDGAEVFISDDFVREHFTVAPKAEAVKQTAAPELDALPMPTRSDIKTFLDDPK